MDTDFFIGGTEETHITDNSTVENDCKSGVIFINSDILMAYL
ncbi:hypothetical protein CSC05_5069 [Escherichia coli]|nr:hypothetical protein CSC05_0018 [Escherichia coli]PRW38967.1 hypothetical protein CSC05_4986 [Escherichia coli]PRW38982.1 hypothetical protein CSC05_5001 [Escherichia coli]PRW38997.1 hypothetical protein CSC05_5016 [Escherichia coli]PRW39013.1 hypothetical protein CSC05_5032 [Escherichia coli]